VFQQFGVSCENASKKIGGKKGEGEREREKPRRRRGKEVEGETRLTLGELFRLIFMKKNDMMMMAARGERGGR
jgi:hypothetical protein